MNKEMTALNDDELMSVVGGLENTGNLFNKKDDKKKDKKNTTSKSNSNGGQLVPIDLLGKSLKC